MKAKFLCSIVSAALFSAAAFAQFPGGGFGGGFPGGFGGRFPFDPEEQGQMPGFPGGGGFGGGRGGQSDNDGASLRYDLEITFKEAVFGVKKDLRFAHNAACKACNGTGAEPGTGKKTCPACNGMGQIRRSSGFFAVSQTCPQCHGAGQIIEPPCKAAYTYLLMASHASPQNLPFIRW